MSPTLIAQLLVALGPPAYSLITQLITYIEGGATVTSAQWATLIAGIQTSNATTEMAKQLQAAGISATDPRYLALIALTKPPGT